MSYTVQAGAYQEGQNAGLDRAAQLLQERADKTRLGTNVTAHTMALIFEALAAEILALKSE